MSDELRDRLENLKLDVSESISKLNRRLERAVVLVSESAERRHRFNKEMIGRLGSAEVMIIQDELVDIKTVPTVPMVDLSGIEVRSLMEPYEPPLTYPRVLAIAAVAKLWAKGKVVR